MSNFGDTQYWDNRYSAEEGKRYQWLQNFETIEQLLNPCMIKGKDTNILHIGCGNSEIQDKLYEKGYHNIVNNDVSTVVIKQMNLQNKYPQMKYEVGDVTDLKYPDKSFDLVLEKSVIDALACSDAPFSNVAKMLYHIYRILNNDGHYFVLSYGKPEQRMLFLQQKHVKFDITIKQIRGSHSDMPHYLYICKKIDSEISQKFYKQLISKLEQQDQKEFQNQNN